MAEEIAWPEPGTFVAVERRAPKPAKPPPPDVALAVGARRSVVLTLSADVVKRLGWKPDAALALYAAEEADRVFLSLSPQKAGLFRLSPPPRIPADGVVKRYLVRLFRCGGIELGGRVTAAVPFNLRGGTLDLAVPRAGDGAYEMGSLALFAQGVAQKAWPQDIGIDDRRVRVAAAVGLIAFGCDRAEVRKRLDLENVLLPEFEDMPRPGRDAAKAVKAALEADDE